MSTFADTMTTTTQKPIDSKAKARVLRLRLLKGLDLILEAQAAGDTVKAASLQVLFDRLQAEYLEAKKDFAQTPEDLLRCPDCPHLGKGILYTLAGEAVICDSPCKKEA